MNTANELEKIDKKPKYEIEPFRQDYLKDAVELFIQNYKDEQTANPLLPSRAVNEPEWILNTLKSLAAEPGVAIFQKNRLIAYMITGFLFPFKGQNTVLVPVFCHSSVSFDKQELYQRMYMKLAGEWARNRQHIHIIGHFAHDSVLQETIFQLGFGAFLAERTRDLSPVSENKNFEITEEKDYRKLVEIQVEHTRYYPGSPIFISKNSEIKTVATDLKSHAGKGDAFLVYYEGDSPGAYFIVGDSTTGEEGFLLQKTGTAQIKAAYTQPHLRGKGIGQAMLQRAVEWSHQRGYKRLLVEHETANYYGGNFWRKYFNPYLYFSFRYIDNTIDYQ